MFDIGATELLLVAIVALLVIGPKDLPVAMRTAGRWIGQLRRMTSHFRVGIDAMIREAEIEEQEKIWAEKNADIMREHPPEEGELPPERDEEAIIRAKEEAAARKPASSGESDVPEAAASETVDSEAVAPSSDPEASPPPAPDGGEKPENPS